MKFQEHVSLAPLTTLGVGGAARFFVEARSSEEASEALAFARARALPVFVLGGGSNIMIADSGFDGLVLVPRMADVIFEEQGDVVLATVGAGMVWDDFVAETAKRGYVGIECLSGIPGTVGGAIVANLGAYGAQASDTFISADVLDRESGEEGAIRVFEKDACNFSYHDSIFSHVGGRYVVLRARFKLYRSGTSRFSYQGNRFNLEALATELGHEPTQGDVRSAIVKMRRDKGMLAEIYRSAGSFFHLPFVSAEKYAETVATARSLDAKKEEELRPWAWEQSDGSYKLASGFLLEYSEFQRGYIRGPVGISPKHTLAIINRGNARTADIAALARDMQNAVEKIFGIRLEREVEYIGEVEHAQ
ncbi:MAG: UDP-N-acetylmuramate dehydrogenase [Patescibacteria group bacterium]|nr:UDP-N-acetylmuramate dehydrogenase [Patescibacteria group bacterium]